VVGGVVGVEATGEVLVTVVDMCGCVTGDDEILEPADSGVDEASAAPDTGTESGIEEEDVVSKELFFSSCVGIAVKLCTMI
jgi:hypothetical protein